MQSVPVWGKLVQKMECADHICKCLRGNQENLVNENQSYKGKGKLCKRTRIRIVSAVRCSIRRRSPKTNKRKAVKNLEHDIRNTTSYIYGDHTRCNDDFGQVKHNLGKNQIDEAQRDVIAENDEENGDDDIFMQQSEMWTQESNTKKKAKQHYGKESLQVEPDMTPEELDKSKTNNLKKKIFLQLTSFKLKNTPICNFVLIAGKLKEKKYNSIKFGSVVNRNSKIKIAPLIKQLLYSTFRGNKTTRIGLKEEKSKRKFSGPKFVGRELLHEWVEENNNRKWYNGRVIFVIKNKDGDKNAVYDVLHGDCEDPYEIDHLLEDFSNSSLKLIDLRYSTGNAVLVYGAYFQQGHWVQFCWLSSWANSYILLDITCLELIPIVLAFMIRGSAVKSKIILLRIDYQALVGIVNQTTSKLKRVTIVNCRNATVWIVGSTIIKHGFVEARWRPGAAEDGYKYMVAKKKWRKNKTYETTN
ncbi:unnamed protein product [Mytilus coruscus]|uniref:Uncharacterized protein n=1 Tax=Mytilus coruscus TaxID=42192 RepID=A0A6J8CVT1_MYTCO|nr:unnamed protein product [Mytilus coruscus]